MDRMVDAVSALALAYYFRGDEAYAAKAAVLLRAWFLDPATRMNPHLEYAQVIPGVNTGRGIGLIETRGLDARRGRGRTAGGLEGLDKRRPARPREVVRRVSALDAREQTRARRGRGEEQPRHLLRRAGRLVRALRRAERAGEACRRGVRADKRIAVQVEPDGSQPLGAGAHACVELQRRQSRRPVDARRAGRARAASTSGTSRRPTVEGYGARSNISTPSPSATRSGRTSSWASGRPGCSSRSCAAPPRATRTESSRS